MATFIQLPSGNWRVQVRRKNRCVAETFHRRKDGEEGALDIERNIDRSGSPKPRAALQVRTSGDIGNRESETDDQPKMSLMSSLRTSKPIVDNFQWAASFGAPLRQRCGKRRFADPTGRDIDMKKRLLVIRDRKDPRAKDGYDQKVPLLNLTGYAPSGRLRPHSSVAGP